MSNSQLLSSSNNLVFYTCSATISKHQ